MLCAARLGTSLGALSTNAPVLVVGRPGVAGSGDVTTGVIGTIGVMVLSAGAATIMGTVTEGLTPRLPISVEPRGMPVRATPPGAVGVEEAARFAEPEPHIADIPDVSIAGEVAGMPDDAIIPCGIDPPGIDIVFNAAALAAATLPTAAPPPSKVAVDPNIADEAVPMVEHPVVPKVPVGVTGVGLTPGEAISVAPSGMPVPPTGALGTMPSGEVAESEGVGVTATCANAWLHSSVEAAVINRRRLMMVSRRETYREGASTHPLR